MVDGVFGIYLDRFLVVFERIREKTGILLTDSKVGIRAIIIRVTIDSLFICLQRLLILLQILISYPQPIIPNSLKRILPHRHQIMHYRLLIFPIYL